MTTEAWQECCPTLCKGIREMDGIRGHPDKWVIFSLDGFGSHLDIKALEMFNEYKILVIKEEGDTSQVSQAYDQHVARQDKQWVREFIDAVKNHHRQMIDQWQLIIIANMGLNQVEKGDAWRKSFIRVNMCPSKRLLFADWLKKHELDANAADRFFKERDGLFDATPACWQHMSEVQRRGVCAVFDLCDDEWTKENVVKVMTLGYVHFDDILKLRGCHLTSKEDPSVFVDPSLAEKEEERTAVSSSSSTTSRQWMLDTDYNAFALAPKHLLDAYLNDKADHPVVNVNGGVVTSSWQDGRNREGTERLQGISFAT